MIWHHSHGGMGGICGIGGEGAAGVGGVGASGIGGVGAAVTKQEKKEFQLCCHEGLQA